MRDEMSSMITLKSRLFSLVGLCCFTVDLKTASRSFSSGPSLSVFDYAPRVSVDEVAVNEETKQLPCEGQLRKTEEDKKGKLEVVIRM
mmetsp:Transcript_7785/g.13716  ORF Transcript_7785/g.13716 Transcript_7785/m.13716 type:complete len:88 (+) Transcript_7785:149-412(+)